MKIHQLNTGTFAVAVVIMMLCLSPAGHTISLDAHEHGLSELTVAMEGETLEIQLISPAMNVVGFEHRAGTPEQIKTVENAKLQLRKHEALFLFSQSHCEHVRTSIDMSSLVGNHNHEHKKHEHNDHTQNDSHSDIIANYQYRCDKKSTPTSITVNLFNSFPGIYKIHAMWVKSARQGAAMLTSNNRIIEFR